MKKTTLALLTFLTVTGCKKDTDRSGPCGPDETIVHHELVIDTNFSDHSLDLHLQGDPYIIGDSLYADFVFDDAYGGEVGFYRNSNWFRSLPQQIEVKARFVNQLPPACDASISLHGPWDLRPIRDLVELYSTSNFFAPNRIIVDATPFSVDEEDSEVIDFDTEISDVNNQWDPVNLWFTNISGVNDTPVIQIHTEGNALDVETSEIQLRVFRSLDNDGNPDPTWPTGDGFNQDNIGNIMRYTIVDNNGFGSTELIAGPGTTFPTPTSFINDFTIDWLTIRPGEQIRIKIRNAGDNTTTTMFVTAGRLIIDSLVVYDSDSAEKPIEQSLIGATEFHTIIIRVETGNGSDVFLDYTW
jgi:hypothetical protein